MSLPFNPILRKLPQLLFALLILSWPCLSEAIDAVQLISAPSQKLALTSGKSIVLRSSQAVKRISITNPEIADFVMLSSKDIYLTGKAAGTTNLMMWNNGAVIGIYDLEVRHDLSTLKEQLHDLLPDETGLKVVSMKDTITLTGTVSNAGKLSQAMALAKTFAPGNKVNNLTEVGGGHQVMLEVRVAEMSKATTKRLGINFGYVRGNEFGFSLLGGLSSLSFEGTGIDELTYSSSVQALFQFNSGSATWTGLIDALQQDGLAKVLAKPTLITMSGQPANFLAGGEFPVPVPQGLGTVAIDYKTFGVSLNFTPVVLSNDRINIQVTPEVSELDFSTAIQFSGYVIPGLSARRTSTTIELGDGQSFAIAGLLKENVQDAINKFPLLGDIPVLGALFRSRSFQKSETELIIVVTPRLVNPLNLKETPLPTDYYVEPNDSEIYLEGLLQGKKATNPVTVVDTGLEGEFGHTMPGNE